MRSIALLLLLVTFCSCASRAPSAKSAAGLTESFFKSYGRKFKTSFFGLSKIEKAQVNGVQQVARNQAMVDSIVVLQNGQAARVLLTTEYVAPFGWKVKSWELLGSQ